MLEICNRGCRFRISDCGECLKKGLRNIIIIIYNHVNSGGGPIAGQEASTDVDDYYITYPQYKLNEYSETFVLQTRTIKVTSKSTLSNSQYTNKTELPNLLL